MIWNWIDLLSISENVLNISVLKKFEFPKSNKIAHSFKSFENSLNEKEPVKLYFKVSKILYFETASPFTPLEIKS